MNVQARQRTSGNADVSAHSIAELLECPAETMNLLNAAAECIRLKAGEIVFRQDEPCRGLYVVVAGEYLRKTDRLNMRVTLGSARPGDIVELASALSGMSHTYTLTAINEGTLMLLPIEPLHTAFNSHPPLRMRLLQELAREVSRAYLTCCLTRALPVRRRRDDDGRV